MTEEGPEDRPIIGADVPWKMIEGEPFRVRKFTAYADVDDAGNVIAPPAPMPYGMLEVESPAFTTPLDMPINHRVDFQNFWDIDQEHLIPDGSVLFVSYLPYKGFMGWILRVGTPVLHLYVMSNKMVDGFFDHLGHDPKVRHKNTREWFTKGTKHCLNCGARIWSFQTRCSECNLPSLAG